MRNVLKTPNVGRARPLREGKVRKEFWLDPSLLRRAQKDLGAASEREAVEIALQIAMASTGWWLADAGGLWLALHAAHADVDFGPVVLAYVAGVIASWVPLLPGGLGAVEIAVPAVLHHFGVPLPAALAGTLLWRGLSLFLPALGGALAYASLRAQAVVATE